MIVTYLFVSPFVRYVVVKLSFIFWVMMGENGAGKSTLMKMITGIYQPDSGEMSFGGKPLSPKSYRESLAMGIDIVHQEIQAVPDASVAENIMLDKLSRVVAGGQISWKWLYEEASLFMRQGWLNPSTLDGGSSAECGAQAAHPDCAGFGGARDGDPPGRADK
jgi:ABC-type branched-subunit amino acid transport system ATPase component